LPVANRQDCLLREYFGSTRLRPVAEAPWEQKSRTQRNSNGSYRSQS
jgi:hypothetical protein